ncbi:MAG TPA: hypothetical protein VHR45_22875 [Thermoanaerobaculia bacterium]|nr:hypothetical protein [Thermoanaerobaculia bacterium]
MRRVLTSALLLFVAVAVRLMAATPWSPGMDCRPEDQPTYDRFEQTVRTAKPGSTVYVPKPYPTTARQAIEDFLYQYKSLHREKADPRKLRKSELDLLQGILESTVTYSVQRVENWTSARCGKEQRRDFYHLIQVRDAATGRELSRIALNATGLWSVKGNTPDSAAGGAVPDAEAVLREVASTYRIEGESPQLVATFGTIYCFFTEPCVAFRQGLDAYILYKGALFQIAGAEPRLEHKKDVGTLETTARVVKSLHDNERLVSIGGRAWAIAREVGKPATSTQARP